MATRVCALLVSLSLSCAVAGAEEGVKRSVPIPFSGLTKSLGEILRARPALNAVIDSLSFSFDRIVDGALPQSFDCDAELGEYLSQEGPLYYESLAEIIRQALEENIRAVGSGAFAMVSASEDNGISYIWIEVQCESAVLLPVYVETADGRLLYSFAIPCDLVCSLSLAVRVDSAQALAGGAGAGVSIDVERLSVRVSRPESVEGDEDEGEGDGGERFPAVAMLGDDALSASVSDVFVDLSCEWTLRGETTGDGEDAEAAPRWIPYGRIAAGDYEWATWSMRELAYTVEVDVDPDSDSGLIVARFDTDDQPSNDGLVITFTDDSGSERLQIREAALSAR